MTVSRRGKSGRRAGNKTHRPSSRNRRVRSNAASVKTCNAVNNSARLPFDWKPKLTKEEWVVQAATAAVGKRAGFGFVQADDLVSDIILMLLNEGGFSWDEAEITAFCKKKSQWMVERWRSRREISECEFKKDNEGSEGDFNDFFEDLSGSVQALQPLIIDCNTWRGRLRAIPLEQRQALEILCDGGNPIDVAEEMGITPWKAIALIREGRDYIHRVDPADERW